MIEKIKNLEKKETLIILFLVVGILLGVIWLIIGPWMIPVLALVILICLKRYLANKKEESEINWPLRIGINLCLASIILAILMYEWCRHEPTIGAIVPCSLFIFFVFLVLIGMALIFSGLFLRSRK